MKLENLVVTYKLDDSLKIAAIDQENESIYFFSHEKEKESLSLMRIELKTLK